jgi:hypothetical protein
MQRLEAFEMLEKFTVQDWPNLPKAKREEIHRKYHRAAFPNSRPRGLTFADLANIQGMGRI